MLFHAVFLFLSLAAFGVNADTPERQRDKDIRLKVLRPDGNRLLTLRCYMYPFNIYVATINKVELYAADQMNHELGDYRLLAAVAKGWDQPKLSVRVSAAEAAVRGKVLPASDEESYLEFSWKSDTDGYCKAYECVVKGLDKDGNPAISYTTNRVKSKADNTNCVSSSSVF